MITDSIKKYAHIILIIGLICLFFFPLLGGQKTLFFRDIHRWFYPMKFFLSQTLKEGSLPYWCSNYFCGSPYISDFQSNVFYPVSALFFLAAFPADRSILL